MSDYVPSVVTVDTSTVGQLYHCLVEGTLPVDNQLRRYGFMIVPQGVGQPGQTGGLTDSTDLNSKQQLLTASPNVIDRDLVNTPRVSQGDFSGGALQAGYVDGSTRYWGGDLDVTVPGRLQLRAQIMRIGATGTSGGFYPCCLMANGLIWWAWLGGGGGGGTFWSLDTSHATAAHTPAATIVDMASDGTTLFLGAAGRIDLTLTGTITNVADTVNGTLQNLWAFPQGTSGYFVYYTNTANQIWKVDLTQAFPIHAAAHIQVPFPGASSGGAAIGSIWDMVRFGSQVAVLTGTTSGDGSAVWTFDGANMSLLAELPGFFAHSMVNCLGDLYVSAHRGASTAGGSPTLFKINSSSIEAVAEPNIPATTLAYSTTGSVVASGHTVYWVILKPNYSPLTTQTNILAYDTQTGALNELPSGYPTAQAWNDAANITHTKGFWAIGSSLFIPARSNYPSDTTSGIIVTQDTSYASLTYGFQGQGELVSPRYDFNTPSIPKLFRRVTIYHQPLPNLAAIQVDAYLDQDPQQYPGTVSATVTQTTSGSTSTTLLIGLTGRALYLHVLLSAGSPNTTTPVIRYYSIEANVLWTFKMMLDCTSNPLTLAGSQDPAGLTGKDRTMFWHEAYEGAVLLNLYHPNGETYQCDIESMDVWYKSPNQIGSSTGRADLPSWVTVTLRALQEVTG